MPTDKSMKDLLKVWVGVVIVSIILIGVGSWCLTFQDMPHPTTLEWEYMRVNKCVDIEVSRPCIDFFPEGSRYKCDCAFNLELKEDLKGVVTLYYELPEFDQTNKAYASSKDDQQLLGHPGARPADSCGNFSYNNDKPIFPCGELADSMFNDTFDLEREISTKSVPVPVDYTTLVTGETLKYKNPSGEVRKNFSNPKNWYGNPWGVLPWETNTKLKGVENPAFRAWMDTSLKRKPVWRLHRNDTYANGLPAGNYIMLIKMHYGVNRYNGPRKIILEGVEIQSSRRSTTGGVILLLLAFLAIALGVGYVIKQRKKIEDERWKAAFRRQDDFE